MTTIPEGYVSTLSLYDTQKGIGLIKNVFQVKLCAALHLKRVTAPLFVDPATGLNDDLNGVERPVGFDIPAVGIDGQVVHSLAKWKRLALKEYSFYVGNGLVTDMNAIRRDEELDNLHSVYVDQWDWEKVIDRESRNVGFLQETVRRIVSAICGTLDELQWQFSDLPVELCREVDACLCYAYLGDVADSVTGDKKAQKFEDDYLEDVFECLREEGVWAVTYMPTRNTPAQLERLRGLCEKYGMFQVSGEDINTPRQSFVIKAMENPLFANLIDATWKLIEHEKTGAALR